MIGERISHFYIIRQLGAGGMGVVYEAQDTRLPRSVAIKVLRSALSTDDGALKRFKREARLASSLNHPNICTVFDVEEADGQAFIAMELLVGRSLKARLSAEPLSLREIIDITTQIADGLAAAHDQGIVHRDIAPGNVFITESGLVKLLDFGLAKHFPTPDGDVEITEDAITTAPVAGTVRYMAPERLAAETPVDRRSDLYSLGVLLYQMAAGIRPFDVASQRALVASIQSEPHVPLRRVAPHRPAELERIIDTLLAKRPEDRYQTARDLRTDLDRLRSIDTGDAARAISDVSLPAPASRWRNRVRLVVAAVSVGVLLPLAWIAVHGSTTRSEGAPFFIVPELIDQAPGSTVTITPDGSTLVYTGSLEAGRPIMLRPLRQLTARALPGTQGANKPIVAPSGRRLAFFSSDDRLKTISIDGSVAADAGGAWQFQDAAWDGDSAIVTDGFRNVERGLSRHVLGGASVVVLTRPDSAAGEVTHASPLVLPGARAVVFTVVKAIGAGGGPHGGQLAIASLDPRGSPSHTQIGVSARRAIAIVDGWLLFSSSDGGAIMAVRLDVEQRRVFGPVVSLLRDPDANMETASLAANGTLLYVRRSRVNSPVLVDADGVEQSLIASPEGPFMYPRVSPDGRRLAVQVTSAEGTDVSVYDMTTGTRTRVTTNGKSLHPTWTPDGRRIVFWATNGKIVEFWSQPSDGSGPATRFAQSTRGFAPTVTPDGRTLLFQQTIDSVASIWSAPLSGDGPPRRVMDDPSANFMPEISRDGKWLAFVSRPSGQDEVFVRAFPGPGTPVQVSRGGGTEPGWSPDGRRIYYRNKRALLSVRFTERPLAAAAPERVFGGDFDGMPHRNYDITPDGKHFVMIATASENPKTVIGLNWLPEQRALLAAARK